MKISKKEFEKRSTGYSVVFGDLDKYTDFEEVHGCEFAHGQYLTIDDTRGEMFRAYMKDHYPKRKYKYEWANTSVIFVAVMPLKS